jgi:drug/metabolite transporter (DMT)-like permease
MFSKPDIEKYFIAEKHESLLFIGIGMAAIITAIIFFFFLKTSFYKGAAIPLLCVGLLLGIVGYTVYARSDQQRTDIVYAYDMNPDKLKKEELPRMKTVMKNFVIYRYVEIALVIIGIALFYFFSYNNSNELWKGFGAGLCIMAMLALSADYFAEKRGHLYLSGLESYLNR